MQHTLNPEIPFVWLHRHLPQTQIAWYKAQVPLSPGGRTFELEVRELEYDVLTTTEEFLDLLPELEFECISGPGMDLFQMSERVPNTLRFSLEDPNMNRILVQNGLFLKLAWPHPGEVALLCSPDREYLEGLIEVPPIRDLAFCPYG